MFESTFQLPCVRFGVTWNN